MTRKIVKMTELDTASFEVLKQSKIALRRRGFKHGVRYANIEWAMRRRFGRT